MKVIEFLEELFSLKGLVRLVDIRGSGKAIDLTVPVIPADNFYNTAVRIRRDENNFFVVELPMQDDYGYDIDEPKSLLFLSEKELAEFKSVRDFIEHIVKVAKLYYSIK